MLADAETEMDAGLRDSAVGTERLCIATRVVKPVGELIRFVVGPDGAVVADVKRKLPGRGVWVTARRETLATAIARKAFARGFKREVRVAADLLAVTEGLLERAVLDALSMVHKAGRVAIGFTKAQAALSRGEAAALIHAVEAAPDGVRKLAAAARRDLGDRRDPLPVVTAFTSMQLDLALGRSNVIHAALLAGPASGTFLARYCSLQGFRDCNPEASDREQCG
jgi:predicted RNA-binding protein YlxR (DUF448 family)